MKKLRNIEDEVRSLYPSLLTEEIDDIIERMSIYNETPVQAHDMLIINGVIL